MRVIQMVSNLNFGDAIGNEIADIDSTLHDAGFDTQIITVSYHEKYADRVNHITLSDVNDDDLLIFHKAAGDHLSRPFIKSKGKKILLYHNITPARYFFFYDLLMSLNLVRGRRQLKKCAAAADVVWADSDFNMDEIAHLRKKPQTLTVLPILLSENERSETDTALFEKLKGRKGTKLLFVGRIAPNKCIEDLLRLLSCYRSEYDSDAVLYIVGSGEGTEKYFAKLKGLAAHLGLSDEDAVFTGKVSDEEKNAYFAAADCFVCMSEHEGFCVPILEAMRMDKPVLAYCGDTAVGDTLGNNGLLFYNKDYPVIAQKLDRLMKDESERERVTALQRESRVRFSPERIKQMLLGAVDDAVSARSVQVPKRCLEPLWKIHNSVYRKNAAGHRRALMRRYAGKLRNHLLFRKK